MLEAKCHHSCGLVSTQASGQEIVLVGGTTGTGDDNKYSPSVQIYNINGNIWRQGDLLIFGDSYAHRTKICIIIYQLLTPYNLYLRKFISRSGGRRVTAGYSSILVYGDQLIGLVIK